MNLQRLIRTFKAGKGFDKTVLINKLKITAAANGSCTAIFNVDKETCNDQGTLTTGFVATAFDTITSLGAMTLHNKVHVPVNINISFYEPVKIGEEIIVDSKVINSGNNLLYLEGLFKNANGILIAKGTQVKHVRNKRLFIFDFIISIFDFISSLFSLN